MVAGRLVAAAQCVEYNPFNEKLSLHGRAGSREPAQQRGRSGEGLNDPAPMGCMRRAVGEPGVWIGQAGWNTLVRLLFRDIPKEGLDATCEGPSR